MPDDALFAALVLTPSFAPRGDSESLVNSKLVAALRNRGVHVDVVSRRGGRPEPVRGAAGLQAPGMGPTPRYHVPWKGLRAACQKVIGSANAQRLRFAREAVWASQATRSAVRFHRARQYQVVLAFGGFCQMPALALRKRLGVPFLAVWNDPFPPHCAPPPYGMGKPGASAVPKCFQRLMERSAAHAAGHVFPSARLRDYMLDLLPGVSLPATAVLPHLASRRPPGEYCASPVLTITHAGGLMPYRPIEPLLQAVAALRPLLGRDVPLRLRFIGPQGKEIAQAAAKQGVEALCEFLPEIPNQDCFRLLCSSDLILVVEADMEEGIFLPAKFAECVETERPILAVTPTRSAIRDLMAAYGGGWAASGRSVENVTASLLSALQSWRSGRLQAQFSSARLRPYLDEDRIARQYITLMLSAIGGDPPSRASVARC
jgi:hypothetical protein